MNSPGGRDAREVYFSSLPAADELAARRSAENSGIPPDDPTWLLLLEIQRSARTAELRTHALEEAVADAAARIESATRSGALGSVSDSAAFERIAIEIGNGAARNDRIAEAVANAVGVVQAGAVSSLRELESRIRDFVQKRSRAPISSVVFAVLFGIVIGLGAIWAISRIAFSYGEAVGYGIGYRSECTSALRRSR